MNKEPSRSAIVSMLRKIKSPLEMVLLDADNVNRAREIIAQYPNTADVQNLLQRHAALFEVL